MSTIDPAMAREQRAQSRQGNPRVATLSLLLLSFGVCSAVVTGLGFGFMANEARDSTINSIFADTTDHLPAALPAMMTAMLGMAALPLAVTRIQDYAGRRSAG